ncbi:hypothetical protein ZIOFF_000743 [Zingiber officinale]|uniref:Mitochondrial protein n=1 Tax=Zingiber officinale TaxID=94328 RepID=A0A8J5I8P2_ZINOF|nr:hypothetical protein ZIOFF_000743 [Zingiber officinale]
MDNSKLINTPVECVVKLSKHDEGEKVDQTFFKSLVGSLRYLTCTKPDILYVVGLVIHYMEAPTTTHLKIAKRILRYIKDFLFTDCKPLFFCSRFLQCRRSFPQRRQKGIEFIGIQLFTDTNVELGRLISPAAEESARPYRLTADHMFRPVPFGHSHICRELSSMLELSDEVLCQKIFSRHSPKDTAWQELTVGGSVEPSRCKFSACAIANRVVLFWRGSFQISGLAPPMPRSWHSSGTVGNTKLVVSGGCADSGVLLSDTHLLDVTMENLSYLM